MFCYRFIFDLSRPTHSDVSVLVSGPSFRQTLHKDILKRSYLYNLLLCFLKCIRIPTGYGSRDCNKRQEYDANSIEQVRDLVKLNSWCKTVRNKCPHVKEVIIATANINQVKKLEGRRNFVTWNFAMQALLESEDLWGCIEEKAEYIADSKKMSKAKAKIILSLDKRNYSHIQETTTPKAAWNN